jgi:hypothetical protein
MNEYPKFKVSEITKHAMFFSVSVQRLLKIFGSSRVV